MRPALLIWYVLVLLLLSQACRRDAHIGGDEPPGDGELARSPEAVEVHASRSPQSVLPIGGGPLVLRDVTDSTRITFRHTHGGDGNYYLVETVASGLATFDFDGDGLVDLYFLNGRPLGSGHVEGGPTNALYRNLGDFEFAEVTDSAGVGDLEYGLGVCVGDFDNDGFPDLFVNNFGRNVLYRNNGDGTFTALTSPVIAGSDEAVGAGANFVDVDGDGNLDLFIAQYVGFRYDNHVTNIVGGKPWYAGPLDYPVVANRLLRNEGDGSFRDISETSGIAAHAGAGMGSISFDFDDDGHPDIFVCNDQRWDFLFRNDGSGRFTEVGLSAGVAANFAGELLGSMGVDCGDYDRDGRIDLYVTSFEQQNPALFRNLGGGTFDDVTLRSRGATGAFRQVKWGVGLVDLDNDGFLDLFIGCGHLGEGLVESASRTSSYRERPVLLWNDGQGKFQDVSQSAGDGAQRELVARGVAFDDLDQDGRIDVVVLCSGGPPALLRNESPGDRHWLQVRLHGVESNRDAVGARVRLVADNGEQFAEVHSGRGYQSHFGTWLHFGLASSSQVDQVEVRWPSGQLDLLENLEVNRSVSIVEGRGHLLKRGSRESPDSLPKHGPNTSPEVK